MRKKKLKAKNPVGSKGTKLKTHAPSTRHSLIGHQGGVRAKPLNQADGNIPVMRKTGDRKKKSLVKRMEDSDMPV